MVVMYYLQNPGGRIVQIESEAEYNRLLEKTGFKKPTNDDIRVYQKEREALYNKLMLKKRKVVRMDAKAVYLATVSQGKKDGYSVASGAILDYLRGDGFPIDTRQKDQAIALIFHNPYSILHANSPYRIIYTMFESTKIPADWPDYLQAADRVFVPSKWCQKVFADSGVKAEVWPLGYDERYFYYVDRPNKRETRQDFKFLHYNAFNIRKGFVEVFKAFNQEFRRDEPVKLVLKTNLKKIPLPINKEQYPNIEIINEAMEPTELADLLADCDAFLFPSRGEGFGMTPLEAMATGMPVVVPNAHGITEYFDKRYMYEVNVKETCPGLYSRYKGQDVGTMSVCDVDDLRKKMRYIYEHEAEAKELGKNSAEYAKQWTLQNTARIIKKELADILSKPLPERKDSNVLTFEEL